MNVSEGPTSHMAQAGDETRSLLRHSV